MIYVMDENNFNNQNATLMTTSIDDDGNYTLSYIPLSIDIELLAHIIANGKSTNTEVVHVMLDCDEKTYWKDMWDGFKEEPNDET